MESRGSRAFVHLVGVLLVTGAGRALLERGRAGPALPGTPVAVEALDDSAVALALAEERRSRPLEPGETLDPNTATEEELDRLPGVGPATARALVAARDTLPFRSPEDLERVRGLGPKTVARLAPLLELPQGWEAGVDPPSRRPAGTRPGAGQGAGKAPVHVNRASMEELQTLPGIGPVLARRIVEQRQRAGPFRGEEDLRAVSGIGPALVARLRPRVRY